ncbi:MAG: FKBP-type peptidyl-prolyl cis-trans isomerase [Candidatus Zixiibacteriota bacterium]
MKRILTGICLTVFLVTMAIAEEPQKEPIEETKKADTTKMNDSTAATKEAAWTTNKSGLKWRDKVVGKGSEAKMNMPVNCHYTVWIADSTGKKGKLVQSSKEGQPLQCTLGVRLIAGWSEGMVGMKEGGTRELIVHPAIGYGAQAKGDMIPANSTLFFEIDFLNEVKQ